MSNECGFETPFMFEDGDHLAITLKRENGGWILSDEVHTYMHLTYDLDEKDLQRGTRQKIITNALSIFSVHDREGELIIPIQREYALVETKGREDKDVPLKARAAVAWCEAASQEGEKWTYLYVPQKLFENLSDNKLKTLMRMCRPSLKQLVEEISDPQLSLPFGEVEPKEDAGISVFIPLDNFKELPSRYQKAVQQAVALYQFLQNKEDISFAPVFTPLLGPLDEAAKGMILRELKDDVPMDGTRQYEFFHPDLTDLPTGEANFHQRQARNLERTLVDQNGLMPIGLLHWSLNYVRTTRRKVGGIFESVRIRFADVSQTDLPTMTGTIYTFRNEYIAHQDRELSDPELAKQALTQWANGLYRIWSCR